ncbi:hypothetical protein [Pseudaeromonas paramecii]|uniref:DUF333 domain-containing protein n=1 Tax=Pseudaeromonas paramecii TaxID=2138166 RepID=A0ABP8PT11_9GAMM
MTNKTRVALAAWLALLGSSAALASTKLPDHGHPPGPPQEAITACSGLGEGDVCSVQTPQGESLDGVCTLFKAPPAASGASSTDTSAQLGCRPSNMPEPPQGGKPPRPDEDTEEQ